LLDGQGKNIKTIASSQPGNTSKILAWHSVASMEALSSHTAGQDQPDVAATSSK
jgi:hypothetical protein